MLNLLSSMKGDELVLKFYPLFAVTPRKLDQGLLDLQWFKNTWETNLHQRAENGGRLHINLDI